MSRYLHHRLRALVIAALCLVLAGAGPALAAPTGGAGGPLTDAYDIPFTAGGVSSEYHRFAAGLDWSRPVGLLVWMDGSGEYGLDEGRNGTYLLQGPGGMIATARDNNMLLITPEAPGAGCPDGGGECWYASSSGWTAAQKNAWAAAVIQHVRGQYNIETDRTAIGGYSSGAQATGRFLIPAHGAALMTDGVFVMVAYGGAPAVTPTFPQAFKDRVVGVWNTGTSDEAYTTASYGAVGGYNWYTGNGFRTEATWPQGVGHGRGGEFGGIMDRAITAHVGAGSAPAEPTPQPTPEPQPSGDYATTVTPAETGVRFDIKVPSDATESTYVRVTRVADGTQKYLYTSARGDVSLTFQTLGTGGDEYTYGVFSGSSTSQPPEVSGSFRTWTEPVATPTPAPTPAPVPGDRDGDGDVDFDDLRALADSRPDDTELRELVDNWTR